MHQNTPVTPQMAELGAAIVAAVHAILADPDAAQSAAMAHAEAAKFSAGQLDKMEKDMEFMAHADAVRASLDNLKDQLDRQKADQDEIARKLNIAYGIHTENVENLADSVKLHNEDIKKHDEDKKQLKSQRESFANEYSELLTSQEENRAWEADIAKREQALQRAAESMGWKQAAKG